MCCWILRVAAFFFFFFQAEDGIRDLTVTGVQTCALPISVMYRPQPRGAGLATPSRTLLQGVDRKSTRLNSSHSQISYAVFCLKKKKRNSTTSSTCDACAYSPAQTFTTTRRPLTLPVCV